MNNEASINLSEEIPLLLSVTDKDGNPIPNAVVSKVVWNQDVLLGTIIPDPNDPTKATFVPAKAGTTHISAVANITVP